MIFRKNSKASATVERPPISARLAPAGKPPERGQTNVTLGFVIGSAGTFALTGLLSSLLFGVGDRDPAPIASVAVLACYPPAHRATKVHPIIALRCE